MSKAACRVPSSPGPPWQQLIRAPKGSRRSLPAPSTPLRVLKKPPPGWATKRRSRAAFGCAVQEGRGFKSGVDRDKALALGPVDGLHAAHVPARHHQGASCLEAGQDADVVFRRRASEYDPDGVISELSSRRSRVVVG